MKTTRILACCAALLLFAGGAAAQSDRYPDRPLRVVVAFPPGGAADFIARILAQHVPAVTIPVFKGPNGLPVGAQLIARRNDDRKLFAAARWAYQVLM